MIRNENKLGLNWAKLSSNWEWTSLEIRFIALNLHANNTTGWLLGQFQIYDILTWVG